jgi:putative membrane protein
MVLGIGRELRGLSALRWVDQLRAEFVSGDAERVQRAARRWLQGLPQHVGLLPALAAAGTPESVLALLRAGPAQDFEAATDGLGRAAALQSIAIVATTPSPAMDVLTVGWCGVRLIRQIAVLHGMRPGIFGTIALLRKTALAAATVAATEFG